MSRVRNRDMNDYIVSILLPICVPAEYTTLFKLNACELTFEDDYWFYDNCAQYFLRFPDECISDSDVITAIDSGSSRKTLWSWSAEKGDIIMDGKLVVATNSVPTPKSMEADRCRSCGTMGEVVRMACICTKCGMVVWGC